eukprot:scaffold226136_cov17-Prasinocladus_malaysianus.AAC.1
MSISAECICTVRCEYGTSTHNYRNTVRVFVGYEYEVLILVRRRQQLAAAAQASESRALPDGTSTRTVPVPIRVATGMTGTHCSLTLMFGTDNAN